MITWLLRMRPETRKTCNITHAHLVLHRCHNTQILDCLALSRRTLSACIPACRTKSFNSRRYRFSPHASISNITSSANLPSMDRTVHIERGRKACAESRKPFDAWGRATAIKYRTSFSRPHAKDNSASLQIRKRSLKGTWECVVHDPCRPVHRHREFSP